MGVAARILTIGASLWVATLIVPGIEMRYTSAGDSIATLLGVALIFGLVNAVLKPFIKRVGCVFYVLTLGVIGLVVNALLFLLVGWLAKGLGLPFNVDGFIAAFLGAVVVSVAGALLHLVVPNRIGRR